jgi:predicted amidophosphoribosyltransferase
VEVELATPTLARRYFAEWVLQYSIPIRAFLACGEKPLLVPVPSSNIVKANHLTDRWPGRDTAAELEQLGFGTCAILLVNKQATQPKHAAQRIPGSAVAENFDVIGPHPVGRQVVFIDDVLTFGDHLAAAASKLLNVRSSALVIGANHSDTQDAYDPCFRTVVFDPSQAEWAAQVEKASPP